MPQKLNEGIPKLRAMLWHPKKSGCLPLFNKTYTKVAILRQAPHLRALKLMLRGKYQIRNNTA